MKIKSYFESREIACIERLEKIINELPYYVEDFFIGVESRTSPLTRLNYAYDLRVFYNFLTKKMFRNKKMTEIDLDYLNELKFTDTIDIFERYVILFIDDPSQFEYKFNNLIKELGSDYVDIIENDLSILEKLL
jgi:hypothetical protein